MATFKFTDLELYFSLLSIVPNAKFSFHIDDGRETNYKDCTCQYIKFDGRCIAWYKENTQPFPNEKDIKRLSKKEIEDIIEANRKIARNEAMSNNLEVLANYNAVLQKTPELSFSDYLDSLEQLKVK